ncbi:MAG: hypothetical protein K2G03_00360 [Bacilli bacterium]|nr:hypothetical protein [Bacilli bacterium]
MDNLINETNDRIQQIIDNLETIKVEYERKIEEASKQFDVEVAKSKKYKEDFFTAKAKIDKMNKDIAGFEEDYKNLVDKFKDDELANILIAANKEISSKVDERKRKILRDRAAMNEVVGKAESVKNKMIKLTAEKKALESCLAKILDSYNYYTNALAPIIEFANEHRDNLCQNYTPSITFSEPTITDNTSLDDVSIDESLLDESILDDSILLDYREISEALKDSGSDDDEESAFDLDDDIFKIDTAIKEEVKKEEKKEVVKPRKDSGEVALVVERSRVAKLPEEPVKSEGNEEIVIEDIVNDSEDIILEDEPLDLDSPVTIEEDADVFDFDTDINLENIINSDDSLE